MSDAQIFQLLGTLFFVTGIGMLVSPESYKKFFHELEKNYGVVYLGGMVAFIIGYILVVSQNSWSMNAGVVLTILGWLSLLKGAALIVFPAQMMHFSKIVAKDKHTVITLSFFVLVLGAALAYLSFLSV